MACQLFSLRLLLPAAKQGTYYKPESLKTPLKSWPVEIFEGLQKYRYLNFLKSRIVFLATFFLKYRLKEGISKFSKK